MRKLLKKIKLFWSRIRRKKCVERIKIRPEKCFAEEEYELQKKNLSAQMSERILQNFNYYVAEVVSLSAEGDNIYMECIGTWCEHFVLTIKRKR